MILMNLFAGQEERCRQREKTCGDGGKRGWGELRVALTLTMCRKLEGRSCIAQGVEISALGQPT